MNKKIFLHIFIPFLLAAASYALGFPFSGTITTGKDVVIGGDIFRFSYDQQSQKAFVQTPDTNLIIGNGNCKGNDYYFICIRGANFSYKNATTFVNYYTMDVEIENPANSSPAKPFITEPQIPAASQTNESAEENITVETEVSSANSSQNTASETNASQQTAQSLSLNNQSQQQETAPEPNLSGLDVPKETVQAENAKGPSGKKALFAIAIFIAIFLTGIVLYKIKSRKKPEEIHIADVNFEEFIKK
jgi:hypothetical protein